MTLLNCKECTKQVSTQAKRCPNCGARAPRKPVPRMVIIITIILWGLMLYACHDTSKEPITSEDKAKQSVENIQSAMRYAAYQCGYSVKKILNDPESAQINYDNVSTTPKIKNGAAWWAVLLPVRAKNPYSAMIYAVYECHVQKIDNDWKTLSVDRVV